MAEHEFERFLEVLSKLLKLSSKETAAVADEICDHLEERYSELVGLGISREDAVKQALDEFEDAGEFATKLNRLVRQRTRRRMMTGALTTAAASALAILVTTAFWPDQRHGGGGIAQTAASPDAVNAVANPDIVYIDEGRFLPEWMRVRVEEDLKPQSILDLKRFLQETTGRIVGVDITELQEVGLDSKSQIGPTPAGAPLYVVLARALENVGGEGLDWLIDPVDGILKISTREKVMTIKSTLTIDVSPLLNRGLDMDGVIDLLHSQTTGPWTVIDGEGGNITPLGNRITIMANQRGQLECQSVLAALAAEGKMIALSEPFSSKAIDEALKKKVSCDFQKVALREVIADFTRQTGQRFVFDTNKLAEVGIAADAPVTLLLKDVSLGTALKLLWSAVTDETGAEPMAVPKNGLLAITSIEAEPSQVVYVLDVSDVVSREDVPQLISLIYHSTYGPWQDIDGEGGNIQELPGPRIIVRQSRPDLDRVLKLLDDHRAAAKSAVPVAVLDSNAVEIRYYRMTEAQANDLKSIIPKYVAVDSWKFADGSTPAIEKVSLSGGFIGGMGGGGGFFQVAVEPQDETPESEIKKLLNEVLQELRAEQQPVQAPMAMLVIRQTRGVHLEIEKFLKELSKKSGASFFDPASGLGAGFGGGGMGGMGGGGMGGGFF